jgi:hypothetical protein
MGAIGALARFAAISSGARRLDSVSSYKPLFVLTILFNVTFARLSCDRRTAPTAPSRKKISHTTGVFVAKCRFSLSSATSAPAARRTGAYWFFLASASTSNLSVCFFHLQLSRRSVILSAPIIAPRAS